MKEFVLPLFLLVLLGAFAACVGTTQTFVPPTAAATVTPVPTNAPALPATATPLPPSPVLTTPIPLPTRSLNVNPSPEVSPTVETEPTAKGGPVITDPVLLKLVDEAKADLTTRANVSLAAITVRSAEAVEWRDSSLGCPQPGMMYAQVITPGYLIVLEAAGQEWNYHAGRDRVMYCDK